MAGAVIAALAAGAWAQDAAPPGTAAQEAAKAEREKREQEREKAEKEKAAEELRRDAPTAEDRYPVVRSSSLTTMPAWEAFGTGYPASVEETFFRLAQDFVSTSEVGVQRLGEVPIWPRGDVKFGPVRILPYLRQAAEYQSNLYLKGRTGESGDRREGREDAWTHINQAGLLAETALMGGRLRIAGSGDARWNVRYDSELPDTWELDSQLGASYRFPQGMWVRGGVAYERRDDPIDAGFTRDFDRSNVRTFLNAGMDKDVLFGSKLRFEFGMSVRDSIAHEKGLDDSDRTETQYYLKASYPFWKETTRIFGRARYRNDERESQRVNDGDVMGFDVGLEGHIPLREGEYRGLRGQVSVGFDYAAYEDDTFASGSDVVVNDDDRRNGSLNVQAALQYLMSPRTTVDLRLLRANQFSFYGNYQIVDRADLTFTHNITPRLVGRVATFIEHTNPSGRFPNETRTPDVATSSAPHTTRGGVGVGLRYRVNEWMDVDWTYDYERRNSQIRPYTNHRVVLGLTFYLNALAPRPKSSGPQ